MNGRSIARILLVIVLVGAAIGIGVTSYDAGVSAGLVQSGQVVVTPGGLPVAPVAPYVGWGWGWGFGHGFGFFGFFFGLLFLLLLIGLIRAAFGGGRRSRWAGPGAWGGHDGPGGWRQHAWEEQIRETHDALHRRDSEPTGRPDDAPRS